MRPDERIGAHVATHEVREGFPRPALPRSALIRFIRPSSAAAVDTSSSTNAAAGGRSKGLSLAWLYGAVGLALGFGAPAGALVIRVSGGAGARSELAHNGFFYLYMLVGTCVVFGYVGFVAGRRADGLRASRERFRLLSQKDDVTELPNARAFDDHMRRALDHAKQFHEPLSLLIIDLDSLKGINDRWGHAVGSASLRHVAHLLDGCKRKGDFAARWGGDEFTILMPGADAEAAVRLAQTIVERVRALPVELEGQSYPVTVTVGAATARPDMSGPELFVRADRALYEGKLRGRNQFRAAPGARP